MEQAEIEAIEGKTESGTDYEIVYIQGVGGWSAAGTRTGRKRLLELYLLSASKRVNWDGIDKDRVIEFTAAELEREGERAGGRPWPCGSMGPSGEKGCG